MDISKDELFKTILDVFKREEGREPSAEMANLIKSFLDTYDVGDLESLYGDSYYHYDHPDYGKNLHAIHAPLDMLESDDDDDSDSDDMEESYNTICERMKELPHDQQVDEVTNLLLTNLDRWHKSDEDLALFSVRACVAMIEGCKLRECLPVLLEILKQDAMFKKIFFTDEDLDFMFPGIIYQIIEKEDLPVLLDFMKTPGLLFSSKKDVAMAVATLPRKDCFALTLVQNWLEDVLNAYLPLGTETDMFDEGLLDTLVFCCIHTQCVQLKDMLVRIYTKYKLPCSMVSGGANEVRKTIKKANIGALEEEDESGEEWFRMYLKGEFDDDGDDDDWDDEDEDSDEEYDDDDFDLDEYDWQDYSPFAFCNKAIYKPILSSQLRKYTIHISLQHISPEVYRDIEVPSNITLMSLAGLILTAMGWDEDHLHQFVTTGRNSQSYATSTNEIGNPMCDSLDGSKFCIGELLKKVGDKVTFEYDYGDSWMHTLKLTKIDDPDEKPKVALLDGKRACPPEDCGSIPGYNDICEAMKDMNTAHAHELIDWLGCKYNPELFPLSKAKKIIERFNR